MPAKKPDTVAGKAAARHTPKRSSPLDLEVEALVASGGSGVREIGSVLEGGSQNRAGHAAKVLLALAEKDAALLAPVIPALIRALGSEHKRVVQASADLLPALVKVVPARVAKHNPTLGELFPSLSLPGKDGVVRTFVALCVASVAYQRRLEPVLLRALTEADPKTLVKWTEVVLPALKGEPYANTRAVVEARLPRLPKPQAKKIAGMLERKRGTSNR